MPKCRAGSVDPTPLPGVGNDLVYRDPWGNPYVITMDLNYDEQCQDAFYSLNMVSSSSPGNANSGINGLINPDGTGTTIIAITARSWSGPPGRTEKLIQCAAAQRQGRQQGQHPELAIK